MKQHPPQERSSFAASTPSAAKMPIAPLPPMMNSANSLAALGNVAGYAASLLYRKAQEALRKKDGYERL